VPNSASANNNISFACKFEYRVYSFTIEDLMRSWVVRGASAAEALQISIYAPELVPSAGLMLASVAPGTPPGRVASSAPAAAAAAAAPTAPPDSGM
jgi:hypothetical protein